SASTTLIERRPDPIACSTVLTEKSDRPSISAATGRVSGAVIRIPHVEWFNRLAGPLAECSKTTLPTARSSSPARARRGRGHHRDKRHRTPTNLSPLTLPARTTQGDPRTGRG